MNEPLTAVFAAVFALIHIFIGKLRFLDVIPRSRWLSAAGGVAVAYVFLHVLPQLSVHQETFSRELGLGGRPAEMLVYAVALIGLAIFYGLERAAKLARARAANGRGHARPFWLHIGSFGLFNVLIGYLLIHRQETGTRELLLYSVAMALHFVTSDFGLHKDHRELYDRRARWVLAAAVFAGWGLGVAVMLPKIAIGFLFAFLAGSVILNVLKEELPAERESRYWPFVLGGVAYAAVLFAG